MKTLILGLGNPLVTDDSVGLRVAAELKALLEGRPDIEVTEDYRGGLQLMERMIGYDRAVIVDAICTGSPPGTIHHLRADSIPTQRSASAHDVNLSTALAFGRRSGAQLPGDENILLVGIEAADVIHFGEECTPSVRTAVAVAVREVLGALERWPSVEARTTAARQEPRVRPATTPTAIRRIRGIRHSTRVAYRARSDDRPKPDRTG